MAMPYYLERAAWTEETARYAGEETIRRRETGDEVKYEEVLAETRRAHSSLKAIRHRKREDVKDASMERNLHNSEAMLTSLRGLPQRYIKDRMSDFTTPDPSTDDPWYPESPTRQLAAQRFKTRDWVEETAAQAKTETLRRRAAGENVEYKQVLDEIRAKFENASIKGSAMKPAGQKALSYSR